MMSGFLFPQLRNKPYCALTICDPEPHNFTEIWIQLKKNGVNNLIRFLGICRLFLTFSKSYIFSLKPKNDIE